MEFRILGPLEVLTDDGRRQSFGPRQTKVLAALLLDAGKVVQIHELIDVVWDDDPPATARRQIQNAVWVLRKHLRVDADAAGYRLRLDDDQLDAHRFDDLVAEAKEASSKGQTALAARQLATALRLWRGPALAGCASRAIDAGAARLNEMRLAALEQRLDLELQLGAHSDLVGELTELVAEHPSRERFVGQLMLALHRCGRRADALATYQRLRLRLVDELGLEPGRALREVHAAILRSDVDSPIDGTIDVAGAAPASESGRIKSRDGLSGTPGRASTTAAGSGPGGLLDRAVADLADAVAAQWRAEAATRSLHQPAPIQVSWSRISDGVSASASAILATRTGPAAQRDLPVSGALDDIAETMMGLPNRQLVVLGPPGAGKSAVAIIVALDLLARRSATDQVPVLFTLSSWDPRAEHLDTWLARRLVEEYPALADTAHYGHSAAAALVDRGRLFPILDGLDELPVESQAVALAAINDASGYGRPVLVTCRGEEFRRAVATGGVVLAHAAVISLAPVEAASAIAYLADAGPVDDVRWAPVFAHLRSHPDGALADALSTPLMVWLARTVYLPPATIPAELLDPQRFATRQAVEHCLLNALVPTVYAARPRAPSVPPSRSYPPAKAAAWLTFLARHLHRRGTADLAWWQLYAMVPRAVLAALAAASVAGLGAVICLLYATVPGLRPGLPLAVTAAVTTVPLLAMVTGLAPPPPWPVRLGGLRSSRRRWSRLGTGSGAGLLTGVIATPVGGARLGFGLLLVGVGGGVFINALGRSDLLRAREPGELHREDRAALSTLVLGATVAGGLCGLLFGGFAAVYPTWLLNTLAGTLAFGSAGYVLGRPRYRRHSGAVPETGPAALVGMAVGAPLGAAVGAGIGFAVNGLTTGLAVVATGAVLGGLGLGWLAGLAITASGWFTLARLYLTARARLPWRLLEFLHDAQRRGVLRQIGGVWQFRHAQLQEHLATGTVASTRQVS